MSNHRRQSIAWRLGLGLTTVVFMLGIVSVGFTWAFSDINRRLDLAEQDECRARGVMDLANALRDQCAHGAHTIIVGNDSHAALFREASRSLKAKAAAVRALPGLPEANAEIERMVAAGAEVERLFESQVLPLAKAGDRAALTGLDDRILDFATEAQRTAELARRTEATKEDLSRHIRTTQRNAIVLKIIAQVFALATAVIVGVLVYRSIARPIATLSAATARVGLGDLETEIPIERNDEFGQLAQRFNEMTRAVKENQGKLLRTERLAALGQMAAAMAHELNNPVGVILGYAKLLGRRGGNANAEMLAAIAEEAERCHQVIDGLLDLTRGSVLPVRCAAVDLRALAEEVAAHLRVSGQTRTSLEIRGSAAAAGDGAKLRQVLVNLVDNAADSCGTDGNVTMSIERSTPGVVSVTVTDSGPGVPASDFDRIFEPFFTTKANGTGLGLPISRAIARAHGGDIVLVPSHEAGATFRLTLPAARQTSP